MLKFASQAFCSFFLVVPLRHYIISVDFQKILRNGRVLNKLNKAVRLVRPVRLINNPYRSRYFSVLDSLSKTLIFFIDEWNNSRSLFPLTQEFHYKLFAGLPFVVCLKWQIRLWTYFFYTD